VSDSCLAVCPGDADDDHVTGRVFVNTGSQWPKGQPSVLDHKLWNVGFQSLVDTDGGRAPANSVADEDVTIDLQPANRDEQCAAAGEPRVMCYVDDPYFPRHH